MFGVSSLSKARRKREVREILGIEGQEEILNELSDDEFREVERMTFSERRDFLDQVAFLIERGTRERKKPIEEKPSCEEELEKQLGETRRELQKTDWAWRYQHRRAEKLEEERRKEEKRKEFERKYGKGVVGLLNPPLRSEKVVSPSEEEDEEKSPPLTFHEPPPKKTRYQTYPRKRK